MTSPNPNAPSKRDDTVRNTVAKTSVGYGWVTNYHPQTNEVSIQPFGEPNSQRAYISVSSDGDVFVPHSGESQSLFAIYAKLNNRKPVVLGFFYDPELHEIPESQAGERKVGHQTSESMIHFRNDGTMRIDADVAIQINDGEKKAIYDIETTTDADGHVTDVTPLRRDDIFL